MATDSLSRYVKVVLAYTYIMYDSFGSPSPKEKSSSADACLELQSESKVRHTVDVIGSR